MTSASIEVSVSLSFLGDDRALLYYSVTNRGDVPVNLSHIYFKPEGAISPVELGGSLLQPGNRMTGVIEVTYTSTSNVYAIVTYYIDNVKYESKPTKVSIT